MTPPTMTVALLGNPNTGKSTLFTALVGVRQRVGNYPGVTVEKKTGHMEYAGRRWELVDLPGLYSLAPRSRDEMVAVDVLLGRFKEIPPVGAVVCIVDASNLRRNLYLVSQVLQFGLPTVVALNMVDVAEDRRIAVDARKLSQRLGIPVVPVQANRRIGMAQLKAALAEAVARPPAPRTSPMPEPFRQEVARLASWLAEASAGDGAADRLPPYLVERLLLDANGYLQRTLSGSANGHVGEGLGAARSRLAEAGCEVPGVETSARYDWIDRALEGVVRKPERFRVTATDRIDRALTHRVWGTLVFGLLMMVVFQAVFVWAGPLMKLIDAGAKALGGWVQAGMAAGALRSLLVDGVIGGVGGVLVFLPQILILFLFIGILEDCGYMGRAAYLMDRLMSRVGLSGKSFIPMLSSFACAIPGIMAARVIEDERDRLTTILVAPLMTCSARLPVYAMLIAAFIPQRAYLGGLFNLQGLTLAALYLLGIVTAVAVALVLKRTLLRGTTPPFVMELPSYKWPSLRTVLQRVVERAWLFVRCAGTIILAVSIVVWAALYYPHNTERVEQPYRAQVRGLAAELVPSGASAEDGPEKDPRVARGTDSRSVPEDADGLVKRDGSVNGGLLVKGEGLAIHPTGERPAGYPVDPWLEGVRAVLAGADGPLRPVIWEAVAKLDEVGPDDPRAAAVRSRLVELDHEIAGAYQRQSLLGRTGRAIEPVFRPLGWDWRIGSAVIASFPAREVVVATLGVIYNLGEDVDAETEEGFTQMHSKLRAATWDGSDRKVFSVPVALSIMVFVALCAQCAATLAVMRRETNSWRWPAFTFAYMTGLAYVGAMITYQVGTWIGGM